MADDDDDDDDDDDEATDDATDGVLGVMTGRGVASASVRCDGVAAGGGSGGTVLGGAASSRNKDENTRHDQCTRYHHQ